MYSCDDTLAGGLPHSDIHGSTPARGSPWLFAACHVLHRLLVPRHPPNALLALEIRSVMHGSKPSAHTNRSLTTDAPRPKPHTSVHTPLNAIAAAGQVTPSGQTNTTAHAQRRTRSDSPLQRTRPF